VKALSSRETELLPSGHTVAEEQFLLQAPERKPQAATTGRPTVSITEDDVRFLAGEVAGRISLKSGELTDYTFRERPLLTAAPVPNFWRAPTDNDFGRHLQRTSNLWRNAGDNLRVIRHRIDEQPDGGLLITFEREIEYVAVPYTTEYRIYADGSVEVKAGMDMTGKRLPELVRFGMKMQLPAQFDRVTYYGRGPWENYIDRRTSAFVGKYACTVDELNYDYIRPQENGYRTDVRYVAFTDAAGFGIRFEETAANRICFNARTSPDEDLDPGFGKKQMHPTNVFPRNGLFVNIDLIQMGVGGDDSWGAKPLDKYRLLADAYSYSYLIRPAER
jgi:beta-galactosidase